MANTSASVDNEVTKFQKKVNREYVRGGRFGKYTGTTENAIIQTNKDLKKRSIPLVGKLKGNGVKGSGTLSGNEEALSNFAFVLTPTHYRNAVLIDNEEREKTEFDLFTEARPALMNWGMELKRDQIIQAMGAIQAGGTYKNYGDATAADLDTWQAANTDRILYGSSVSNLVSGDHTASLATIDTTNDKMTPELLTLIKRLAKNANPLIRPVAVNSDEEMFVCFVDSYVFRDLRESTTMQNANREARERSKNNPLFTGGDLMWDNIVIVEVADFGKFIDGDGSGSDYDGVWGANAASGDSLATGGDSSSRVSLAAFCGAQAIGFLRGKNGKFNRKKEDDYDFQNGIGIEMKHDIKKMFYNTKQHGMITAFVSAAKDV